MTTRNVILGIDPGAKGALCFFDVNDGGVTIEDMPTVEISRGAKSKTEISPAILAKTVNHYKPNIVILERVGAMPGQGVSSMFQFGRGLGIIEGVVAALDVPVFYVTPQRWQKDVGVRGGKDGSRARAAELFPKYADLFKRKKDDGRAESALIAWWGATR